MARAQTTIVIWKETYTLLIKARGKLEHRDGKKRTINDTVRELALSVLQH